MTRATYGNIRKRGARWQARYTDPAGVRRILGTFDTKAAAAAALARVTVATVDGTWRPPEQTAQTLAAYIDGWQARRAASGAYKPATQALNRELIDSFILKPVAITGNPQFVIGDVPLSAIKKNLVHDWVIGIRDGIKQRAALKPVERLSDTATARAWAKANEVACADTGRLSPTVLDAWRAAGSPLPAPKPVAEHRGQAKAWQAYRLLHAVLADAVRDDVLIKNPCMLRKRDVCPAPARKVVPATVAQISALTDAVPDNWAAIIQVASYGGLRFGELRALRRDTVTILHDDSGQVSGAIIEVVRGMSAGVVTTPKTGEAGKRTVVLPTQPARYLAGHLGMFVADDDDALLFPHLRENAVWYRALKRVGMEGFRFHDLRHTFASLSVASGVEARAVQAALGHSTASMTAHYTHAAPDYAARVAAGLNAVLEADSAGPGKIT